METILVQTACKKSPTQRLMKDIFENVTSLSRLNKHRLLTSGPEVIQLFSYSTHLSTNIILLIIVKMPIVVGILTFINMINTTSERFKEKKTAFVGIIVIISS